MAKINTNLMNDIAESLKDSTKNLSSEEKKKVENEVLQEAQQKIENKQKQLEETASKTSEELNNYADKIEETEKNIVSSASDLDSVSEIPRMNDSTISNAVVERKSKQKIDDIILNATEDYNNQVKLAKENAHELEVTYNKYAGREINKRNQYIEDEYNINSKFKEEVDETIKETEEKLRKLEVTNNRYSNREINKRNQYIEDEYNINSKFKKDVDVTRERAIKVEQDKINKLQEKRIAEVNEWANEDERNKYELTLLHRLIYGNSESNKTILENAEIIANDNDGIKEEYYKEHGYVTGGDLAVGAISIVEGVGIFGENIIKAGDLVLSGLATGIGALDAVLGLTTDEDSWNNFKIWNKELWDRTASRISKDYVSSVFDSFYNNIGTGQDIKQSSEHFETARSFGVGVGYVGASLATAGTISGLAGIASGTTSASLINAGIYGTARFGGSTGDAVQNGASMDEALIYGYLTGLKEATGMFIGSQINQWNPFGTGTPIKTIANSFVHVACDTADGAVSAVIDPLMQSFYTPSEEMLLQLGYTEGVESYKNLSPWEKYKFNFEANGGWNTVWGTAKFSGIMSLASEIPTMAKEVIDYSKGTNLSKNITKNTIELDDAMKNGDEAMVESLNAKNLKLQENFNGLTDNQRYYYNLATLKNNIENGDFNPNLIDSFIRSDNAEILFNNLSKEDKKLLANAMNGNQSKQFLDKVGDKTKNTFLKLSSSYPNSTNVEISNQPSVTSKIGFQFFAEPSETDLPATKEFIDNARELSSQGKITQEFTSNLTDNQYKAILLQVDENPKLVSDVIGMSNTKGQIQQVKNAIKSMDGDEIAKVIDVDGLDMGFITRDAINNLDESQVTDTLIRRIASLDDEKFIKFVNENANSALYNNQEIFDRAIATATKEQIDFISSFDGVHIWNFSDEVQFKILSNKEYVTQIIGNDPFQISETMRKVSLDSSKALLNNIDIDALDFNSKMKIARSLSNCDNVEIQNLFFEQSKLLFDDELKAMSVSDTIKFIGDIKSPSIRQNFIEQCGILNKSGQLSSGELLVLIRNISDEDIRFNLIIDSKNQEVLDCFIGDVGILLGPDKFEKFYKYLDSDKKMLLVNDITLENKEFVTEIKKLIDSDPTLIEKMPKIYLKNYFEQMDESERTVLLSKMTPKMSIDIYSSDILSDGEKIILKNNLFNHAVNIDDDSLSLKFFKLLDDSEQQQFLNMKSGIDNNHLKQYIESAKNDTLKSKIFELVTIVSDEDLNRLYSNVLRLTPHDLKLFEQSIDDKTFILYSLYCYVDSLEENVMQRFKKNHVLFGNYGSEEVIELISDSAREEIFKVVKEEGNEILEKMNLTKLVGSDFFGIKDYSKIIEMEQLGYLSKENCDMLLNMYEKNPHVLKTLNVELMNPEISDIGELFIEKMSRYPRHASQVISLQQSNPEKFATFKLLASELANDDSLSIYNEKLAILLNYFESNSSVTNINPSNANNYIDYIMNEYSLLKANSTTITDRITLGHYSEDYQRKFSEHLDNLFKNAPTVEEKKNVLMTKLFGLSNQETEVFLRTYYDNLSLGDIEQCRKLLGNETMDFILNVYNVSKIDSSEIIENLYNSSQGNKQELIKVIGDLKKVYAKTYNDALEKTATLIRSEMANCTTIKALGEFSFDNFSGSCMINVNGKLIPVIEAPDEFSFMAHSTGAYGYMEILSDSYSDSWNYSEKTANHGICCSYITDSKIGTAEVSGQGVLFGFSGFSDESIQRMGPYDIYSKNNDINSQSSKMPLFVPAKDISSETVNVYNEFVIERTELRDGINNGFNNIQPNYVFVLEEWSDALKQNAIKAASDFEPPLQVVYISRNKVATNAVKRIDTDLSSFASTHDLTFFENALNTHESTRTSFWHSKSIVDYDETFPTSKITSSIDDYLAYVKSSYDGVPESRNLYINELKRFKTIIQKEQTRFDGGSFHESIRTSFDLDSTKIIQQIDGMIQYIKGES